MNAALQTVEHEQALEQPHVRKLAGEIAEAKKLEAKAVKDAAQDGEKLTTAQRLRQENNDASKAGFFMNACRTAQANLEDSQERLRIIKKVREEKERELEHAILVWTREEKERELEALRAENASIDAQMLALQKRRVKATNAALARLHSLDRTYPGILAHGEPSGYLTGDVLVGKRLPSIEITDTRATFKWLELPLGIKN